MIIKDYLKKHTFLSTFIGAIANIVFILARKIHRRNISDGVTLVIALHKLGDTVFTIPAISALIQNSLDKLIILCFEESKPIYEIAFQVNENLYYMILPQTDLLWEGRLVRQKYKKELFGFHTITRIIDLTGGILSASILIESKANLIIGSSESLYKSLYDKFNLFRNTPHLTDLYLDSIKLQYPSLNSSQYKYSPISYNTDDPIMIHAFAGWAAKEWNIEKFLKLIIDLRKMHPVKFILPQILITNQIQSKLSEDGIEVIQSKTVLDLINILRKCSLLISNDSGPLQIASLLGKPTYSIFGPTNPSFAVPFGEHHKFIRRSIVCSPLASEQYCYTDAGRKGCPSFECMNQLSEEAVFADIKEFLVKLKIINLKDIDRTII